MPLFKVALQPKATKHLISTNVEFRILIGRLNTIAHCLAKLDGGSSSSPKGCRAPKRDLATLAKHTKSGKHRVTHGVIIKN